MMRAVCRAGRDVRYGFHDVKQHADHITIGAVRLSAAASEFKNMQGRNPSSAVMPRSADECPPSQTGGLASTSWDDDRAGGEAERFRLTAPCRQVPALTR